MTMRKMYLQDRARFLEVALLSRQKRLYFNGGTAPPYGGSVMLAVECIAGAKARMGIIFDKHLNGLCGACRYPCCRTPSGILIGYYDRGEILTMNPVDLAMLEEYLSEALPKKVKEDVPSSYPYYCPFLGKVGCKLPRPVRSYKCTSYICGPLHGVLSPEDYYTLSDLRDKISIPRLELMRILEDEENEIWY